MAAGPENVALQDEQQQHPDRQRECDPLDSHRSKVCAQPASDGAGDAGHEEDLDINLTPRVPILQVCIHQLSYIICCFMMPAVDRIYLLAFRIGCLPHSVVQQLDALPSVTATVATRRDVV